MTRNIAECCRPSCFSRHTWMKWMNSGGGAWDNAKKRIETGEFSGKQSKPHKAAALEDTLGDPFKGTAGPSTDMLIKLLCTVTFVMAPLFLR